MQLVTFGSIPPEITPASISLFASLRSRTEIRELLSSGFMHTPSTSVKNASFSAFIAPAIAHAASSALILYVSPASSIPIGAIIGI